MVTIIRIDNPMIGTRHECLCCGRKLTITDSYDGDGPEDPPGYYYQFDGISQTRWISATGAAVRFRKVAEQGARP